MSGLSSGLTGMWMAEFYPIPEGLQAPILRGVRLVVGAAMVMSIVFAWSGILRRKVAQHEAWMIRFALGQGAGTQAWVLFLWLVLSGEGVGPTRDLLMTLAWAINIVVAEWIISRRRQGPYVIPRAGVSELRLSTSRA